MESKLRNLKVAELKEILQSASVAIPAKANKADLINKIIATPAAIDVYNKRYGVPETAAAPPTPAPAPVPKAPPPKPSSTLSASDKGVDWTGQQQPPSPPKKTPRPPSPTKAVPSSPPKATNQITQAATVPTAEPTSIAPSEETKVDEDPEVEKRRQRAARFGIPFVEPGKPKVPNGKKAGPNPKTTTPPAEVDSKLAARAERFGIKPPGQNGPTTNSTTGQKRTAAEEISAEELERRKKRSERFGVPVK